MTHRGRKLFPWLKSTCYVGVNVQPYNDVEPYTQNGPTIPASLAISRLRQDMGLSCQQASQVLPGAAHLKRGPRSKASAQHRSRRGFSGGWKSAVSGPERAERAAARRRMDSTLHRMSGTLRAVADDLARAQAEGQEAKALAEDAIVARWQASRLASSANQARRQATETAKAALRGVIQLAQESEGQARAPAASNLSRGHSTP